VTEKVTGDSSQGSVGETLDGAMRVVAEPGAPAPAPAGHDYPVFVEVDRDHYVMSGEIAKGGMGRVIEARDRRLGRPVAIKELLPKNRAAARRFEREARITARLQHPAIVHVYEAGVWRGGEPFYAMQKVSGRSLDKVVAERTTLAERLGLLPNVIAAVDALSYAHSQNVIHRDLKPSNVLVGEFGETVVIDWGLAKDLGAPADAAQSLNLPVAAAEETLSGSVVGTPAYMPPEQARGELVDQRADVYALGALLYHVLVGAAPYTAPSSKDVLRAVLAGPPPAVATLEPGTPADLTAIVGKAMARDPAERYANGGELAADLKRFQTGQLVAAHTYSRGQLLWRFLRRHRVAVAVVTLAAVVLVIVGELSIRAVFRAQADADAAAAITDARRAEMLAERGRVELLAGRAGQALVNLLSAAELAGKVDGAIGFLIADAVRAYQSEIKSFRAGTGPVGGLYSPDGTRIATVSGGVLRLWSADGEPLPLADAPSARIAAWNPIGTRLAVGCADGTVRLVPADGGSAVVLSGHTGAITNVEISADGQRVLSASADGTARLWDAANGAILGRMEEGAALTTARLSPDGKLAVTATTDGRVTVWDVAHQAQIAPLRGHTAEVRVVEWSPAGDRVLTASLDGTVQIWDPQKGKPIVAPLIHEGAPILAAAFSSDGLRVITGGADRTARIWQLPTDVPEEGALIAAKPIATLPHTDSVSAVTFSRDDRWIATATRVARVWDATGQPVASFELPDAVSSVQFNADATRLLAGTTAGNVRLFDLTRSLEQPIALDSSVHALVMSHGGRLAAGTDDSRVTLWGGDAPRVTLRAHLGSVFAAAFSSDGHQLVTAGEDPDAWLWDLRTGHSRALPVGEAAVGAAAFSPAGDELVLADRDGTLWAYDANGRLLLRAESTEHTGGTVPALTASTGVPPRPTPLRPVDPAAVIPISSVAFDRDGKRMVTTTVRGLVQISDGLLRDRISADAGFAIAAAMFDPTDPARVAIGGAGEAQIWRITGGSLALEQAIEGPTGDVRALAFTHDGTRLVTAGADGLARIWNARTGRLLGTRDPHGGPIDAIAIADDDQILWTGSADGTARAWRIGAVTDVAPIRALVASRVPWVLDSDYIVRRVSPAQGK
jgi:WD40 repeat protein/tRNA A-37 threonylcarbamoyl transferase component Bud32